MTLTEKDIKDLIELVNEKIKECKERSDTAFMKGALAYWRELKKKLIDLKRENEIKVFVLKEIENKIEKWNKEEIKTLKELEKDKKEEDFFGVGTDGFYLWTIRLIISELHDIKRLIEKEFKC